MISSGLKSHCWQAVADPTVPKSWSGQRLSDYTAQLSVSDSVRLNWPNGDDEVDVHAVNTRVRQLSRYQVVIER